jgi:hypothetical protein
MNYRRVAVASLLSLVFIGCGGGSSVSTPTQPGTPPTQPASNGTPTITALIPSSATAERRRRVWQHDEIIGIWTCDSKFRTMWRA